MIKHTLRYLTGTLLAVLLGWGFASSAAATGAYSIANAPLFITISMPANIIFLFDDSGSLQWAHVPDWYGDSGIATVNTTNVPATNTLTYTTVVSTSAPLSGSVVVTAGTVNFSSVSASPTTLTSSVIVTSGTPISSPVQTSSTTLSTSVNVAGPVVTHPSVVIGGSSHHWTFSCSAGTESSGWIGTSSSSSTPSVPSGDICTLNTYTYSCTTPYTLNPSSPTTGTSSTGSGYTCKTSGYSYTCSSGYSQSSGWTSSGLTTTSYGSDTCTKPGYNYACSTGYTLNPSSPTSGSSSTGSGYTCQEPGYSYSCASGYTLNPSSPGKGTSNTGSGYSCQQQTYNYSCSSGFTLSGSTTGTTSTAPSGTTCSEPYWNYSCPSGQGYTLGGPSSGGSSTAAFPTNCSKTTGVYACPTGNTSSGSGSSMKCSGWSSFNAVIDVANDDSSGPIYTPDTNHYKCACFNTLAYDPTQTYLAGYSDTGTPLSTSFTAAYVNPYVTSLGSLNLATSYEATVDYPPTVSESSLMGTSCSSHHGALSTVACEVNSCNASFTYSSSSSVTCNTVHNAQAAFYYTLTPTSTAAVAAGCGSHTYIVSGAVYTVPTNEDDSCLTKVVVSSTSGPGNTDERQNFANWFSFYRTRNLTVNTGANRALTTLSSTFRIAWRDLNTMASSSTPFQNNGIQDWAGNSFDNRIATFSGTHRTALFDWLERYPANNGTGLRTALDSIGNYYQTPAGVSSPFAFNPQVTDSPEYVCRPSYAVVFTDGLWNDNSIPSSPSISNADASAMTLPDGTSYTGSQLPYADTNSQSLADIAFYYWSNSLRSDLGTSSSLQYMPYTQAVTVVDSTGKTVPLAPYWNPANDPADWPHMITFTVGLGMTSTITSPAWGGNTYAGGYNSLVTGTTPWPTVSSGSSNNVYDLWHAAIDSRGQFFSVDTPQDVAAAFNSIINRIQGRVGSSSAIAVNSTRLDSNTFIYQAEFNSGGWTGEVAAFPLETDGSIGAQAWAASTLIPAATSRSIYSWDETLNSNKGGGISFLWTSLNTTEQTYLNTNLANANDGEGSLRLNYLRGDQSQEQSQGGNFRTRSVLLGDIVNSNPAFVGPSTNFGNAILPGAEGSSYTTFLTTKSTRTPMLYVGANDGMVHALNATTGVEQYTYVPRGTYANLSALTDPNYSHQYYVDGSPIAEDAYVNSAWKTLLVGTTGGGARDVYLLDVTNPSSFSTSSILWDYDATVNSDNNLGYTIPTATISRLQDGDWYVIFGNGYNSPNQHAVLYLYNLRTKVLKTFDTGVGSASSPNGMSAGVPVDYNSDRIIDAIYAGDLLGNVWKLDVSSSNNANWKFFTYGTSSPKPFYTAADANGNVQPITDRVQVGLNSSGQVMVYFGTGTYFETNDNTVGTNPPVMSFYGLLDDKGNTSADNISGRTKLLEQFIVAQSTGGGNTFRITTSYAMTSSDVGWFMDFNYPSAQGERVVSDAVLDNGAVVFPTVIPQGNACQFGGVSWLMVLNGDNGGAFTNIATFDVNGDGTINNSDFVTVTYTDPVSGQTVTTTQSAGGEESNVGIIKTPAIISNGTEQLAVASGSTGGKSVTPFNVPHNGGRMSWQVIP